VSDGEERSDEWEVVSYIGGRYAAVALLLSLRSSLSPSSNLTIYDCYGVRADGKCSVAEGRRRGREVEEGSVRLGH